MILIDVAVPALNEHFDVQMDETVPISTLIDELTDVICQSQKLSFADPSAAYYLCATDSQQILPLDKTLTECEIRTGMCLILV